VIPTIRLLGLEFADLDVAAAATWLARRPAKAPFGYVTTPNADHLVRLSRQPWMAPLYRDALMRLLDSRVVARVARLAGLPAPRVTPGSDLTEVLLTRHLAVDEHVTIVGLQPEWLPALVARCGLAPPAHYDPPMGFIGDAGALRATVEFVLMHPARFVFLAVGRRDRKCWLLQSHRHAKRPALACASAPALSSSQAPRSAPRCGFSMRASSGCIGWARSRGGWRDAICATAPRCFRCCCASACCFRTRVPFPG
jgi:UDP-N-acetyl-D-mannosaminuronic acid transferase (WecB/TagA/CpsF family)